MLVHLEPLLKGPGSSTWTHQVEDWQELRTCECKCPKAYYRGHRPKPHWRFMTITSRTPTIVPRAAKRRDDVGTSLSPEPKKILDSLD